MANRPMTFQDGHSRLREPAGAPDGFNPTSGLTQDQGVVRGARGRIRAALQEVVAYEARGRSWPSRAAQRAWVRAEVAKRYRELVVHPNL